MNNSNSVLPWYEKDLGRAGCADGKKIRVFGPWMHLPELLADSLCLHNLIEYRYKTDSVTSHPSHTSQR
jgi:hypothetical protein